MGHSTHVSLGSCETASSSTARLRAQNQPTWVTVRRPDGISRSAVRGLRASMSASISRFSAIARLRAPTIAIVIHPSTAPRGTSIRARTAAANANGSAKIVCEKRTSVEQGGHETEPRGRCGGPRRGGHGADVTGGASAHGCGDRAAPGTPPSIGSPGWMEGAGFPGDGPWSTFIPS